VLLAVATGRASADQFVPTRHDDPVPGACKPGDCSLREAIQAAENQPGRDEIVLSRGTYDIEIPDTTGTGIEAGDLNLSGALSVIGRGPSLTKVDGNGVDRVFTAGGNNSIRGLTVKGGDASMNPGHTSVGGGVAAFGEKLVLGNVKILKNQAHLGGGVESTAAQLKIVRSTLHLNRADEGAGLDLRSSITQPVTTIKNSTLDTNIAELKGAGILADGFVSGPATQTPVLELFNTTIAGNVAVGDPGPQGGGLMADNGASVGTAHVTIAGNRAGDVVNDGIGGGLYQHSGATIGLGETILANNYVGYNGQATASGPSAECAGSITGDGGNLLLTLPGNTCIVSGGTTGTNNAGLGALGDHGGPTKTIPLLSGSPAIGLGVSCFPRKDQRGSPRPETGCDSGAFERQKP
jgi:CSLREA domain-containing protein